MAVHNLTRFGRRVIKDPPFVRFLFADVRMSWVWLPLRVWLGYEWLVAGLHKVTDSTWVNGGAALQGFWTGAIQIPAEGRPPIAFGWYREFIAFMLEREWYTWFAPMVAWGEVIIGVALIVGAFVGLAALFGALMNWNYIMAGSASSNGLLLIVAILLVLAWKTAGYLGADYILLRWLGVPWKGRSAKAVAVPGQSAIVLRLKPTIIANEPVKL